MSYTLPTESDLACVAWRQWWARHMSLSPLFGPVLNPPVLSRDAQYDRYMAHGKHCVHCQKHLLRGKQLKRIAPIAGLLAVSLAYGMGRFAWPMRLLGVGLYALLDNASEKMTRAVQGPVRGDKVSAAQFGN
jgi:hypothetical protein